MDGIGLNIKEFFLKIGKSFNYKLSITKIGFVALTAFLFFAFNDRIIHFIEKFLMIEPGFSNFWLDISIIGGSLFAIIFIGFKFYKYRYLASFTEIYLAATLSAFILFFYIKANNLNWIFHKDEIIKIEYIWFLIIPLFLFLFFFVIILFKRHFIDSFIDSSTYKGEFKNDDPIFKINEDKLGYSPIVARLSKILIKEKFKKSFSIGLVGPWGNGKSSVINLIKDQLHDNEYKKQEEPIIIHFLPYLNHKEDDIINEFFIALSSKLSTYNGKLSNQIVNYSQKLTELYQDTNILNFVDNHISNISNKPAKELYDEINIRLKEINKKIIVFVDDLDRLNDKEILQILKLIRNTADFYNTIFVVAMDKQYVLSRLAKQSTILNSNFVDKFFQLEVFLPEIDQTILKEYVGNVLLKSLSGIEPTFESKLMSAFSDDDNLFEDYVKNFRDAKRIINQVIYDYGNFGTEIDLKDFLNFTYFKLKFPQFIKLLNDNRLDYLDLETNKGIYKLKEVQNDNDNTDPTISIFRSLNTKSNDYKRFIKYDLYKKILSDDSCFKDMLNIDCEDRVLLIKTLAYLFGDENPDSNFNSIRKVNNFRMLMQQRVFDDLLTEIEFNLLMQHDDVETISLELKKLSTAKKIDQLINRFEYYSTDKKEHLNNALIILLQIFNMRDEFVAYDITTLSLIGKLMQIKLNMEPRNPNDDATWLKTNVFQTPFISTLNKINIINELWKFKNDNYSWGLSEDYIKEQAKKLYDKYLEKLNVPWQVSDFSFYGVFQDLKTIPSLKEHLVVSFKEFWRENKIELLCAQTLSFASFSVSSYNISDFEKEIFETKENFYQYVNNHQDKNEPGVKEFLEFLHLCSITQFKMFLKFNFSKSDLVLKRLEHAKMHYGGSIRDDDYKNIKQVILETNDKTLFDNLTKNNELIHMNNFSVYENNELYHILVSFKSAEFKKQILAYTQKIYQVALSDSNWEKVPFVANHVENKKSFIPQKTSDKYIKVISIQ